ncbi:MULTISPECIES: hypothetical protein [unclassified Leucobacter]|uniref:hypothetical protein n=1 Tax=unclassified Leucobacter TaxID=2621730 RepID=UPI000620FBAC|nr:hypothetical protein [Leucobacter sp. Ag1]KKI18722.1 hypothetical protein XM48_10595 [Leucobacter sp. Ag1]
MQARRYRKKPVEIEAILLNADTVAPPGGGLSPHDAAHAAIAGWMLGHGFRDFRVAGNGAPFALEIGTLEGTMTAAPGDFVIRGVQGEFYPCKPDIFAATYSEVTE